MRELFVVYPTNRSPIEPHLVIVAFDVGRGLSASPAGLDKAAPHQSAGDKIPAHVFSVDARCVPCPRRSGVWLEA